GLVYVFTKKDETPEEKTFYARYELRDEDNKLIELLQSETWNDWDKMEQGSVATANIFADTYGQWNVEAKADGLVYVFTKKDETPEEKTFYARYELRDEDGKLIKVLQTETWEQWDKMEQGSVATANIFAETYGNWDVEAYPDGLVYVFTKKDETPLTPLEPSTPIVPDEEDGTPLIPLEPSTPIVSDDEQNGTPLIPLEPSTPIVPETPENPSNDDKENPTDDDKKSSDDDKKEENKDDKKEDNKKAQIKKKTTNNVKTGVAGMTGVIATLAAATSAYFVTKKND
ncbi:MAG: hypothetical protein ACTIH2_07890, partial [Anaerococcus sp.]